MRGSSLQTLLGSCWGSLETDYKEMLSEFQTQCQLTPPTCAGSIPMGVEEGTGVVRGTRHSAFKVFLKKEDGQQF